MTSPSETIAKAMEGVEQSRLAIRTGGSNTAYAYSEADEDGDYLTVEDAKRIIAPIALQFEAMKREMTEKDERIAALEAGLKPFADIADVFDFPGGNRPTQGIIAAWSDHRIGDREFTVESVRRARTLIQGEKQ